MKQLVGSLALVAMSSSPAFAQDNDPVLREMRLEWVGERQTAGAVLLGWGAANFVAGSLVAAIGYDEPALVGGGLISASFGLINGLLALTLFDLSGSLRAEAESGRIGDATFGRPLTKIESGPSPACQVRFGINSFNAPIPAFAVHFDNVTIDQP